MNKLFVAVALLAGMLICNNSKAQSPVVVKPDTLLLKLVDIEKLFLEKNFLVLAQQYRVDASSALVKQASLWANPEVYAEVNLYNPNKKRFLDAGSQGEKIVSVSQLVSLAGERNKRVKLAQKNKELTELEFLDLIRTLKLQLRDSYFELFFLNRIQRNYSERIASLSTMVAEFDKQEKKGNIALKEVLRLKALLYDIQNQSLSITVQLNEKEQVLQTLIATNNIIVPAPESNEVAKYDVSGLSLSELVTSALANRSDLLIQGKSVELNEANYRLQKAGAYPDLHIGATYDQAGSYINNYTGVTMAFDLPVWNRNQGNIKAAKYSVEAEKLNLQNETVQVQNEVINAYRNAVESEKLVTAIDTSFSNGFDKLNNSVLTNYKKQNMNLIEFIDFFETYINSVNYINQLKATHILYCEELNFNVGKELFK